MSDEIVMVGDYLGTIEEYMPGQGTYAEDGKIYASRVGQKVLDPERHTASVLGRKPPVINVGQTVFGEVMSVRKSNVTVLVSKIRGEKGVIDDKAMIYVSNISDKYVEKPEDFFKIGDIVEAKVIKMDSDVIDLSTKGDMGVVKAFCSKCRTPLSISTKYQGKMECPVCGSVELRKTAKDYENVSEL
ncbi:MAG: exosome complex RNA-binding protein Csl4 [Candidatus Altiarchaeota archaeon]